MTDVTGIEYTTTHDWKPAHFTPPEIAEAQVAAANDWSLRSARYGLQKFSDVPFFHAGDLATAHGGGQAQDGGE